MKQKNTLQTDYNKCYFHKKEWIQYTGYALAQTILVAWLFYQSPWGLLTAFLLVPFGMVRKRREHIRRRRNELMLQFRECIRLVAGALAAGYSMEHAWQEAQKDMEKLYGKKADMYKELTYLNHSVGLQEPIEQRLLDFASRSGLEDVEDFAQIFLFAKRSGGNFIRIIQNTSGRISDKIEIMQEIETTMAAKRFEQRIMNVVPMFILLYIRLASPEFLASLYGNVIGAVVMSVCLLGYGAAILLSEKIIRIEV